MTMLCYYYIPGSFTLNLFGQCVFYIFVFLKVKTVIVYSIYFPVRHSIVENMLQEQGSLNHNRYIN